MSSPLTGTDMDELRCQLALTQVAGVGGKRALALLEQFGTASAAWKAPVKQWCKVTGITAAIAQGKSDEALAWADKEIAFMDKKQIRPLFMNDEAYPKRFLNCADPAIMLFYKGNGNLNATHVVAVIGTRKNTDYGLRLTEELIDGLKSVPDVLVTSGLAYGIDAIAHRRCVQQGIPTVGVLGHGLQMLYPPANKALSEEMQEHGGILSEFPSGTLPERTNFPVRNRVVAGISDVTVVVESDAKGGAMITAYMAASYNREVAAYPGRTTDAKSAGPNKLIRTNVASMITGPQDLLEVMGWAGRKKDTAKQPQLFLNLSPEEQAIIDALQGKDAMHADELALQAGLRTAQLAATLLQLEMMNLVKTLPGKRYRLQ